MKGICFIPPLFHLNIEEIKNQTRRTMSEQPDADGLHDHTRFPMSVDSDMQGFWGTSAETGTHKEFKPKYRVGERIYLKEPYYYLGDKDGVPQYLYRFQVGGIIGQSLQFLPEDFKHWSNKLFMPAKAARFFIEITGVRPERLQDISEEDCIKEGISQGVTCLGANMPDGSKSDLSLWGLVMSNSLRLSLSETPQLAYSSYFSLKETPQKAYAALFDKINGKGTWDSNPWMWVYDYKLVKE